MVDRNLDFETLHESEQQYPRRQNWNYLTLMLRQHCSTAVSLGKLINVVYTPFNYIFQNRNLRKRMRNFKLKGVKGINRYIHICMYIQKSTWKLQTHWMPLKHSLKNFCNQQDSSKSQEIGNPTSRSLDMFKDDFACPKWCFLNDLKNLSFAFYQYWRW